MPEQKQERYRVVMDHPDDPVSIYDASDPDEPLVATVANADEADAWIQDHEDEDVGPTAA
jgi:hypothetical protein